MQAMEIEVMLQKEEPIFANFFEAFFLCFTEVLQLVSLYGDSWVVWFYFFGK